MMALFAPDSHRRKSPLLMALLLVGAVAWLSPMVAAARRSRLPERSGTSREIVLPVASLPDDVCVQGTSIAGPRRFAVIDGCVVGQGEQIERDGVPYRVIEIEAESVRLRPASAVETAASRAEPARH